MINNSLFLSLYKPVKNLKKQRGSVSLFTKRVAKNKRGDFRLLVIEENETYCKQLISHLKSAGFNAMDAANGDEALLVWQDWKPHLILMDQNVSILDGYDIAPIIRFKLKKSKANFLTKFISLTDNSCNENEKDIIAKGYDKIVKKSVKNWEIYSIIEDLLEIKKSKKFGKAS